MPGWIPFVSPPSGAPTGRVVQNGFSSTTSFAYKNFMKAWGAGSSVSINGNNLGTLLDADGFPNGTPAANYGGSLFLPPDCYLGAMRFKWTGTLGNFFVGLNMTASSGGGFLSGSFFSGTNGDVTFTINATTTSTTSNSIALGNQTYTVGASLSLSPADKIVIAQTGTLTNYMLATVVSYSGTTLVANINTIYGSGTFTSWNVWATPSETNSFFSSGSANSGLSNMILCRDQDYSSIAAGGIDSYFYHKFLSVIQTENPLILRPMGETVNGGTELLTNPLWALRKPLTAMSWAQTFSYPPSVFAGNSSGVNALTTGSYSTMPGSWTDKETFLFNTPANTVTISIASPALLSLPKSVVPGEVLKLYTTGALPTGVTTTAYYYALDSGTTNIRIAATPGGAAINTSGTQSGTHSMSQTTALVITAIASNGGADLPRLTLESTSGLTTGDVVTVSCGNIGTFTITVIDATHIDLASSYPSGAVLNFSAGGQVWSASTGLSPITDPGNSTGRSFIATTSINVGSRGAKLVSGINGMPLAPGILQIATGNAGGINSCTYDAITDSVMIYQGGLYAETMMLELQIALANKLNKHLWYEFGVAVADATVTSAVQFAAANLNSQLKLHLAYSNETWNGAFTQYYYLLRYAVAKNYAYNNSGSVQQAYTATGIRTLQIMNLASTAWTGAGRSTSSLRRIISIQAFGSTTLFQTYLLNGNDLPAPNNASPNRPVDRADICTWANYWNGVLFNGQYVGTGAEYAALVSAASDYASGNPSLMASALTWVYNDVMGLNGTAPPTGTTDFSVNSLITTGGTNAGIAPGWEAVFASYDATRAGISLAPLDMVAYEGGPDLRAPTQAECTALGIGSSFTDITNLLEAFKYDTLSGTMIVNAQAAFIGVSFPHFKNGSFLQLEGPNEWSLLSGNFFARPYQMYYGAAQFNS